MSVLDFVNLSAIDLKPGPAAHFVKDGFLESARFAALSESFPDDRFAAPEIRPFAGGRRDLEHGMESYRQLLLKSPVWRECLAQLHSRQYAELLLDVFGPHLCQLPGWRGQPRYWRDGSSFLREQQPLGSTIARAVAALRGPRLDRVLYQGISRLRSRFFPDGYTMLCTIASAWLGWVRSARTSRHSGPNRGQSHLFQ